MLSENEILSVGQKQLLVILFILVCVRIRELYQKYKGYTLYVSVWIESPNVSITK